MNWDQERGGGGQDRDSVLIFRNHLLPFSETFIKNPAEMLSEHRAVYVGSRRVEGLSLPEERIVVCRDGTSMSGLHEIAFKLGGFVPTRMIEQLRSFQPKLLHAHFGPDALRSIPIVERLGIPLIVTYQGIDATLDLSNAWGLGIRGVQYVLGKNRVFRRASRILTVSRYLADKLTAEGAPAEKVEVLYTGVDCEQFKPEERDRNGGEPIVLFVGRLVEKKGVKHLIDAMEVIEAEHRDVTLKIIGDGPLEAELRQRAATTLDRYQFLGRQTPQQVRSWMDRARVLCVPSVVASTGDSEGLPNVVLEAQAMATPVVGFAHAGIPEAVTDGETGLLAEEGDVSRLTEYLQHVISEPQTAKAMGRAGRQRMLETFNMHHQVARLEDIYREVARDEKIGP